MRLYITDSTSCITGSAVKSILGKSRNTVFIVPEPAKAQVERCVINTLAGMNGGGAFKASVRDKTKTIPVTAAFAGGDVVSFLKLSDRILGACGVIMPSSGDIILRNAIYDVLAAHHDEFNTFGNLMGRCENINKLISILGDFARYRINAEEIGRAVDAAKDKESSYVGKLKDIKLLMEYLNELSDMYSLKLLTDPIGMASDILSRIGEADLSAARYRQLRMILSHDIAVVQFGVTRNLTPGEYALLKELDRLSRGVDIYLNGSMEEGRGAFYKCSDQVIRTLKDSCDAKLINVPYEDSGSDLTRIAGCYSEGDMKPLKDMGTDKVVLSDIEGTDSRIGYIMDRIMDLTRREGYRYRDIRIVCCDEDLTAKFRSIASGYGLDIFIDRKIALNNTAVPKFVELFLKLPISRFRLEDVLAILRSGMLKVHPRYVDIFENYCVAKNIVDSTRMFNEANYDDAEDKYAMKMLLEEGTIPGEEEKIVTAGCFVYGYIVERVLMPLRKSVLEVYNREDMAGKAEALFDYLDSIRDYTEALRDELMDSGKTDVAEATIRAYDETMALLAAFMHEMNRVEITQRNFLELYRTDMMNKVSGTIPLKVDSVEITSPEHAYYSPCKVMFILGAKRDNFPYRGCVDGIMSSSELSELAGSISVTLPDKKVVQSREEFITSCLILGAVTDRLYMIHEHGAHTSRVFDDLAFCVRKEDIRIDPYKVRIYGEYTPRKFDFKTARISPELMDILLKDGMKVSVTTIEKYMECPIEFMFDKVLGIRERDDNREVKANHFGTLAHKMFEVGVEEACKVFDTPEKLGEYAVKLATDPELLDQICEEVLERTVREEKLAGSLDADGSINRTFNNNQGNKLRRMFRFLYPPVLKECADSRFMPRGYELRIGEGDYLLRYGSRGHEFSFTGSIDRLDVSADDPNAFRIQDYKTYVKAFDPKLLLNGVQIQLPAYAASVCHSNSDLVPVDMGYSKISLDITTTASGPVFKQKNANLGREEMDIAIRYADHVIKQAIEDISAGIANALLSEAAKGHSDFHKMMGLSGNPQSKPVTKPAIEVEDKNYIDKMSEILGETEDGQD